MQLGEDAYLRAQELRYDGDSDIVDCAALVALDAIRVREVDGGDEDDRGFLETRMPVHHVRELKAVDLRHADVHQHDGDIVAEQLLHGLAGRPGLDQVCAQLSEDRFIAEQLAHLIIDHQYVGSIAFVHGPFLLSNLAGPSCNLATFRCRLEHLSTPIPKCSSGAATCEAMTVTAPYLLVWQGTPMRPPADTFRDPLSSLWR